MGWEEHVVRMKRASYKIESVRQSKSTGHGEEMVLTFSILSFRRKMMCFFFSLSSTKSKQLIKKKKLFAFEKTAQYGILFKKV